MIGDYKPGYIYGTVKIHKTGCPLGSIISQLHQYTNLQKPLTNESYHTFSIIIVLDPKKSFLKFLKPINLTKE